MFARPHKLFGLIALSLSLAAGIAQAAPGPVDTSAADMAAKKAESSGTKADKDAAWYACVDARGAALNQHNVEALLLVAEAFQRAKWEDEAQEAYVMAWCEAMKWARYDGSSSSGGDYLYGRSALQNVATSRVKFPENTSAFADRGLAKQEMLNIDAELAQQCPRIFDGQWQSPSGRITMLTQFGAGITANNDRTTIQATITGIQNDTVAIGGTFTEKGSKRHGNVTMTLNLRSSNQLTATMTYINDDGSTQPAPAVTLFRP